MDHKIAYEIVFNRRRIISVGVYDTFNSYSDDLYFISHF